MLLTLDTVEFRRENFVLHAEGTFSPGTHLLTGRIGSGKSTLGELLRGELECDSGKIIQEGIFRLVLSMQFPEYHITTTHVDEEIMSWGHNPAHILKEAGLLGRGSDDLLTLSRGELKRLHLACLLAGNYDLMVLDEPFAGLDDEARCWIVARLDQCRDRIVIIISHDITTLPRIDHIWEMQDGILTYIGPVPIALLNWKDAPPLIRYLVRLGLCPAGLSWNNLAEAVCKIPE
ncbi:MAG: energy-coupling factor ABC transporter ATP-binding protein [Methanobacteriota archaeon]